MKRFHIALSTSDINKSIDDYNQRLGAEPVVVVPDEYALWRTDSLNFSIRKENVGSSDKLRHLGWEDSSAKSFSLETDANGIVWERFTSAQQLDEINEAWPEANHE